MLILNIPHSSTKLLFKKAFIKNIADDLLQHTDLHTDKLYDYKDAKKVVAKYSRFVVDTERFWDDELEIMAKVGMGALYINGLNGDKIRNLSLLNEIELKKIKNIYDRHHKLLEKYVEQELNKNGKAIIIDCHSFSSNVLAMEKDLIKENIKKPEIDIGFDEFHINLKLLDLIKNYFKDFDLKFNYPYSGSIVPTKYYNKNKNVISFMIETRRDLYMDEKTGELKLENFKNLKKIYKEFFDLLSNEGRKII
jgi:N-formylglutamate amidohydrolase